MVSSWPLPQSLESCAAEGCLFKKSALRSQRAVEAKSTRSLLEGGSGGRTGASDPAHPRASPIGTSRPAKSQYRIDLGKGRRIGENNSTIGTDSSKAETKKPALHTKSGLHPSTIRYPDLLTLGVQHTIFSRIPMEVGRAATDRIHRAIDCIIKGVANRVRNEAQPPKRMVIDG